MNTSDVSDSGAPGNPGARPIAIEFDAVDKWYGSHQVLHNISLTVSDGERIVICGPSGSGKSTAIRCINQLEAFQGGRLSIKGRELMQARPMGAVHAGVGMVFQQFNLFPHLSVLDNCTLASITTRRMKPAEARDTAMALLARVQMAHKAEAFPGQLSGGQQQRVAIVRALCLQPQIMLFDEPTSALDPEMVKEVLDTLLAMAGEGMTMVVVTHEMGFARQFADRVIFMESGKILEIAPPGDFFQNSTNARVQSFLGQLAKH